MRKIFAVLFLLPLLGYTQPLGFSSKDFDFQTIIYPSVDSLQLIIDNPSGFDVGVEGITVFSIYNKEPFFVKDSVFTITAGSDHTLWIYFQADQNIFHELQAVVHTDFRGDYLLDLKGIGQYSNPYYADTFNKREQDLKDALKVKLASGYQQKSYNVARDNMYGSIDNVNGDVTCVYTARVATFNTRPGANSNNFNCEHTFPQGFFNQGLPMRSDVHHLFPTDVTSNSQRGNLPFGIVSGSPSWSNGGSKKGGGVFEPRDDHKGDVARALFYFVVRYQDYSNHVQGQESILRDWYLNDLPSAKEIQRNDDIYALQNNRNPFVDYPQLLYRINKISGNSVAPSVKTLFVSRDTVDMRYQIDSLVYTVSIVNTGNELITITNFDIPNSTNFSFDHAMSDIGLLPGEGVEVKIRVQPTVNTTVTDFLTFDSDAPGMSQVSIALLGNWVTISTPEIEKNEDVILYPNPTNGSVQIIWNGQENYQIEIYNVLGELVYSGWSRSQESNLQIDEFTAGAYWVKVIKGDRVKQTTLLVK
jgi:hypothetical protein